MKVELDLRTGPYPGRWPNQIDIQKNIDSLSRAIKRSLALLREECPEGESNFYVAED